MTITKIIYDSLYLSLDVNCNNLPSHIEYLELSMRANKKEILPFTNNLPVNLKYLKINILSFVAEEINDFAYGIIIEDDPLLNNKDILLKPNIKLPLGCKLILPNDESYNIDKIFFKLKYNYHDANFNNYKNKKSHDSVLWKINPKKLKCFS
jgi:hypothetical protein